MTTRQNTQIAPVGERVSQLRTLLDRMRPQIALALPRHLSPDRMLRIAMTSIQRTPKLLECTQQSLLGAIIQSAQLGLEPDGVIGHAYLVPYGNTVTLIVGYKGLIDLARRSGQLSTIYARVVHERDVFSYAYGLSQRCEHVPTTDPDPGPVTHVYAVAKLKDGGEQFEVMNVREIDAIRKRSRAGNSGPWVTDWEEMAKKTVIRRLCKLLPAAVELARAVALDERAEIGLPQHLDDVIDVEPEEQSAAIGKLDQVVQAAAKEPTVET